MPPTQELVDFSYRETFHLSYKDFIEEPFEEYLTNLAILEARERYKKRVSDAQERLNK